MRIRFAAFGGSAPLLGLALLVSGVSCKARYPRNQPVKAAPDACCKVANETMTKFSGCRLTDRCTFAEPIWLRGAVSCGVVEQTQCGSRRCCTLDPRDGSPDGVLNRGAAEDGKAAPPAKRPPAEPPPPVEPPARDEPTKADDPAAEG